MNSRMNVSACCAGDGEGLGWLQSHVRALNNQGTGRKVLGQKEIMDKNREVDVDYIKSLLIDFPLTFEI